MEKEQHKNKTIKLKYMALKKKKEKIKIMGTSYKVDIPISDTLKAMSDALRSHEVALLTWVHKDYESKDRFTDEEVEGFRDSLRDYCGQIPESENILKRMEELDKQLEEDQNKVKPPKDWKDEVIENEKNEWSGGKLNSNQEKEIQNKQEKDTGAKD